MKKYEIVYIIHPDLEGSTAKITEKIKGVLEKNSAVVLNEESWGKKKLAYEIGKNSYGIYEFMLVEMDAVSVKEVERTLRLSEEIIRSMVVQAEEEVEIKRDLEKKAKRIEEAKTKEVKKEKTTEKTGVTAESVETPKKTKKEKEKEEKERQKELDEKLQEIIGPDKES